MRWGAATANGCARATPQWRRIEYQELNRHHGVLYSDFFCPERHSEEW